MAKWLRRRFPIQYVGEDCGFDSRRGFVFASPTGVRIIWLCSGSSIVSAGGPKVSGRGHTRSSSLYSAYAEKKCPSVDARYLINT